eukprot:TRINITY_DN1978_c0_g1_i1.p2 TRINITY_DN1978_c0_g1~~TRINITY_DN1978_c0_g1_i1.p2  ORF type:complete len:258 (-),score=102.08 TRINITY_DN1978_c0_g1_i1:141-854(-)
MSAVLNETELATLHLTCPVDTCGRLCTTKAALTEHMRLHRNVSRWRCHADGCGKTYSRKGNLQAHIKQAHEAIEFACPHADCTKVYHRKAHLQRHVAAIHQRVVHVCDDCGAEFVYKHVRDQHARTEHGSLGDSMHTTVQHATLPPATGVSLPPILKRRRADVDCDSPPRKLAAPPSTTPPLQQTPTRLSLDNSRDSLKASISQPLSIEAAAVLACFHLAPARAREFVHTHTASAVY